MLLIPGFAISVAPFLLNTLVALGLLGTAAFVWVGLSAGMHSFPSKGDAREIWRRSRAEWRTAPMTLLGVPFVFVIYVANLLSVLWFDAIYALGLFGVSLIVVGSLPV